MSARIAVQRARSQRGYAPGWLVMSDESQAFASTHDQAMRLACHTARIRAQTERTSPMPTPTEPIELEVSTDDMRAVLGLAASAIDARMSAAEEYAAHRVVVRVTEALDAAELAR